MSHCGKCGGVDVSESKLSGAELSANSTGSELTLSIQRDVALKFGGGDIDLYVEQASRKRSQTANGATTSNW